MKLPRISQQGFTPIMILIAAVLIGAVAFGGYYYATNLNKPARIKEKTQSSETIYNDYHRAIKKVADQLQEESDNSDTDSMERYLEKGNGLVKTAKENEKNLKPLVEKMNIGEMSALKKKLEEYLQKSAELIRLEEDDLTLLDEYIEPLRDYEDLTLALSGVSNYIYSDPARYIKEVTEAIAKEEKIIQEFESFSPGPDHQDINNAFIKNLKSEVALLEQASAAVRDRNDNGLTVAIKKYSEAQQENSKELNRLQDEFKEKVNNLVDEIDDLNEDIEKEYDNLKSQFSS